MIVIPAVDLRDGACVQLVGGSYEDEKVRLDNPLDVVRSWAQAGFKRLHLVDLDAATERGSNEAVVRDILREGAALAQVGGGVRSRETIDRLLADGAAFVVLGTRALEDHDWLEEMSRSYPGLLIVAADVRERRITTRGWSRTLDRNIDAVVDDLNSLPLAALMVTAVHREGQMAGTDLRLMEDVVEESIFPVIASGGISGMADLHALEDRGVAGAVVGMALYTGVLTPRVVAEEFAE